ncbi:hypothetical protein N7510_003359 [Penicillium lagena]|uniref:uncharacterized protein n=1 Tax=Penicillium lagena TaxID=94218 RepID=UPI00253F85F8|nr:uncharacterized protein N7510_003359 [Penicillium lagena]KAJ5619375.1 hypothetical protein N7510_003359 [Penicillium lagena]
MSDDEEYYEFEDDYLWDDVVPDLVDELAASSYYDASYYDDPAQDVQEFFSDWEYYSDDYYDEDTSAATKTEQKPTTKRKRKTSSPSVHRGPPPVQSITKPDLTSFQGVVWKTPSLERDRDVTVQIYEPGYGDKVALLENWREVFKSAQPGLDKSRLRKKRTREESRRPSLAPAVAAVEPMDTDAVDTTAPAAGSEAPHQLDSSDQMSDVPSLENLRSRDGDAGDASNTTPEQVLSPDDAPEPAALAPAKRGRKRKAETSVPEDASKDGPAGDSVKPRGKRVASRKLSGSGQDGASQAAGSVRRSTRQKK